MLGVAALALGAAPGGTSTRAPHRHLTFLPIAESGALSLALQLEQATIGTGREDSQKGFGLHFFDLSDPSDPSDLSDPSDPSDQVFPKLRGPKRQYKAGVTN